MAIKPGKHEQQTHNNESKSFGGGRFSPQSVGKQKARTSQYTNSKEEETSQKTDKVAASHETVSNRKKRKSKRYPTK